MKILKTQKLLIIHFDLDTLKYLKKKNYHLNNFQ